MAYDSIFDLMMRSGSEKVMKRSTRMIIIVERMMTVRMEFLAIVKILRSCILEREIVEELMVVRGV